MPVSSWLFVSDIFAPWATAVESGRPTLLDGGAVLDSSSSSLDTASSSGCCCCLSSHRLWRLISVATAIPAAIPAAIRLLPARAAEIFAHTRPVRRSVPGYRTWRETSSVIDSIVGAALPLAGIVRRGEGGATNGAHVNDVPHCPAPSFIPLGLLDHGPSPVQSSWV